EARPRRPADLHRPRSARLLRRSGRVARRALQRLPHAAGVSSASDAPPSARSWYLPGMDPGKVAKLKQTLLEATDFHDIVAYFFQEFGNGAAFARAGGPMNDERFLMAPGQVAARTVGAKIGVFRGTPARVAEHRLVHGAFTFGTWTVMMFYFEDVQQGF